jgi:hypothetical protein
VGTWRLLPRGWVKRPGRQNNHSFQSSYFTIQHLFNKIGLSFVKQQFVVTDTIRQNKIPVLLDIWVTNTPFVKTFYP